MKLLGCTKVNITKDRNGKNLPCSEITEVVLVACNIVDNDCQQKSTALYNTFVFKKLLGIRYNY